MNKIIFVFGLVMVAVIAVSNSQPMTGSGGPPAGGPQGGPPGGQAGGQIGAGASAGFGFSGSLGGSAGGNAGADGAGLVGNGGNAKLSQEHGAHCNGGNQAPPPTTRAPATTAAST